MFGNDRKGNGKEGLKIDWSSMGTMWTGEVQRQIREMDDKLHELVNKLEEAYKQEFMRRFVFYTSPDGNSQEEACENFCDEIYLQEWLFSVLHDDMFPSAMPALTETPTLTEWIHDYVDPKDYIREVR